LKNRDGKIFYHSNEHDETAIDRSWASLVVYYFDMACAFFEMFKEQITPVNSSAWGQEMELWRKTFGEQLLTEARARREADDSR
jgi:hypothetical protein